MQTYTMEPYLRFFLLFFALFNPSLMSVYLLDLIRGLFTSTFAHVLVRGTPHAIAGSIAMPIMIGPGSAPRS